MLYAVLITISIIACLALISYLKNSSLKKKKLAAIRLQWGKPVDDGRNFKLAAAYRNIIAQTHSLNDATATDLDLDTVFNFVDRTNSKCGQQYLYNKLYSNTSTLHEVSAIDTQINALPADSNLLETYQLKLSDLGTNNAYYLPELFKAPLPPLFNALTTFYIRVSGIVTFTLLILTLARPNQYYFITLMGMVMLNFAVHYANKGRIAQYTHSLPQLIKLINAAKWFRRQQGTTPDEATAQAINNTYKLKRSLRFVSISEKVNDPTDITFALMELLRILFLLEPLMFVTSINRVNKYRLNIGHVYEYVSRIDFLISIMSLRAGLPFYSKPQFNNDSELAVDALYHPLVDGCIPNDMLTSAHQGVLITGSNMSGKTTFIRAMAINTLLSQTLFTSCSKSYRAPWLNIHTSIRISDDVEEHKSYFQAEAISVLDILKKCDAAKPVKSLVIIDEIFRGTNTIERIAAAKAVLAYLTANSNFVFVSTHDLELAELLGSDYAVYSFEELVTDGARLIFDYKIKPGLLKNKNGIAILNALGYPQTVVDDAGVVSEQLREKYQL